MPQYSNKICFEKGLDMFLSKMQKEDGKSLNFQMNEALIRVSAKYCLLHDLQYCDTFFQWNIAFAKIFSYCTFLLRNISILFQYFQKSFRNFRWICLKFNIKTSWFNFCEASYTKYNIGKWYQKFCLMHTMQNWWMN